MRDRKCYKVRTRDSYEDTPEVAGNVLQRSREILMHGLKPKIRMLSIKLKHGYLPSPQTLQYMVERGHLLRKKIKRVDQPGLT